MRCLLVWLGTTAMHIPDGYLSPITSLIMFLLVFPFWVIGVRRIRQTMNARSVPLIALLAAFSFVIMMFNVPLPGGTTGHAVGAALAAVLLGPEIATIAVSIALIIQAFFFGDGGILAIGANAFNMAVVVPYVSFAIYRLFARNTALESPRRIAGAALGGWVGLTAAAFFAGVEFGLQPLLFHTADGTPLYAPYPLAVAIPAMVRAAHADPVGGRRRADRAGGGYPAALAQPHPAGRREPGAWPRSGLGVGRPRWIWVALVILVVASPLGLLAPGTAWGEWSTQELAKMGMANVPTGIQQLSTLWGAPLAHYNLPILGNANLGYHALGRGGDPGGWDRGLAVCDLADASAPLHEKASE